MLFKTHNFEIEVTRLSLYLRFGRWDRYWGPLN